MKESKITIGLSPEEAIVFYDWICRFNEEEYTEFEDQAEQRVLWDIESILESKLAAPLNSKYDDLLQVARSKIRDEIEG
ncbi:hypothetical protein SAMN04487866_1411 [Thermoactinomyces sp. DSM 45891]|uniref:hypothetical protein n=1 Tax=unclassified Thermoactinomyces TaxID=2634588 RepID=UPI00089BFB20|nr:MULTISPECIES: hypothetical protein [unclassified Thermoactinomyces]SDZ31930.1 hypothetical protein SAMN05444416_1211 [Thermoactinomyces sp. DSM 45892]SFX83941.1 hypothetical protein SAMN04487866_1401 [Thermoactinomyces sp. DSM 45891]SFX84140.1 hypothetical protein SAMN04487866_1411 [Thermoactinomyces sp. DSM 45891]